MSEQSEALAKLAREKGLIPPEEPSIENGGAPLSELLNGDLPKVELPGPGRLLSQFARESGRIAADKFMYRREALPLMVNAGDRRLDQVDADAFRSLVEQKLVCFKKTLHQESTFRIVQTMPVDIARGTLRAPEFLGALPCVERVNTVRLPVLRAPGADGAAGKIELLPDGFDRDSRTYTFPSAVVYDEAMSLDAAVEVLTSLTSEFPFGDWPDLATVAASGPIKPSRSQAVVIAGMLTMFAAGILPVKARKPVFVYTSNSVGSGKTLLAQLAVVPVRGEAAISSWPQREEELHKLLDAAVQNGDLYLLFDNLRGMIRSPSLEGFVTSSVWTGRVLGGKEKFSLPNYATVFLTGNQATVNEDMDRRCLFVELFVQEANIQERKIARLIDETWLGDEKNRSLILSALWALVRAWDAAGRPPNEQYFASFDAWTRAIGGIVLHAGLGNCAERVALDAGGNTEMEDMRALLLALSRIELAWNEEFEFSTIVKTAVDQGLFDWILPADTDPGELSPKERSMFGKLLKKWCTGRTFDYPGATAADAMVRLKFGYRGKHRGRRYRLTRM